MTWAGSVPQVICGSMLVQSMRASLSKRASGSVTSVRHQAGAASQSSPVGAAERPAPQAMVFSSGAIRQVRAPHWIVRLLTG